MRELHRSAHFVVTVDEARGLLRRARTERGFESEDEIEAAYGAAVASIASIDHARYVLLVDVRLAPPRNDAAYEAIIERLSPQLFDGFRRVALLARTEVGRLQIGRLVSSVHPNARGFTDEAAALAYLLDDRAMSGA
jgi:phage tail sheath gpL-like